MMIGRKIAELSAHDDIPLKEYIITVLQKSSAIHLSQIVIFKIVTRALGLQA